MAKKVIPAKSKPAKKKPSRAVPRGKTAGKTGRRTGSHKSKNLGVIGKHRRKDSRKSKQVVIAERDPAAVKMYGAALKGFNSQEFARARDDFQKVIEQFPKETEVVERARVHLNICLQRLARNPAPSKTSEDYYNVAIAYLNRREFDESEAAFQKALSMNPKGDHIVYGLATLESLRGQTDLALKHLQRALHLNPANRMNASHDPDLESLFQLEEFKAMVRGPQGG